MTKRKKFIWTDVGDNSLQASDKAQIVRSFGLFYMIFSKTIFELTEMRLITIASSQF